MRCGRTRAHDVRNYEVGLPDSVKAKKGSREGSGHKVCGASGLAGCPHFLCRRPQRLHGPDNLRPDCLQARDNGVHLHGKYETSLLLLTLHLLLLLLFPLSSLPSLFSFLFLIVLPPTHVSRKRKRTTTCFPPTHPPTHLPTPCAEEEEEGGRPSSFSLKGPFFSSFPLPQPPPL